MLVILVKFQIFYCRISSLRCSKFDNPNLPQPKKAWKYHKITNGECHKIVPNHPTPKPKDLELIFKIGKCNHKTLSPIQSWNLYTSSITPNCQQKSTSWLARKKKQKPKTLSNSNNIKLLLQPLTWCIRKDNQMPNFKNLMKWKQDPTSLYMCEIETWEEKDTTKDIIPFY